MKTLRKITWKDKVSKCKREVCEKSEGELDKSGRFFVMMDGIFEKERTLENGKA